jgi:translation initiation factor 1 (eIF-1/SUI1)
MKHASNKVSTQVQIQGETMRKLKKLLMNTPEDIYKKKKTQNTLSNMVSKLPPIL